MVMGQPSSNPWWPEADNDVVAVKARLLCCSPCCLILHASRGRCRRRNSTPAAQPASGGRERDKGAGRNQHWACPWTRGSASFIDPPLVLELFCLAARQFRAVRQLR